MRYFIILLVIAFSITGCSPRKTVYVLKSNGVRVVHDNWDYSDKNEELGIIRVQWFSKKESNFYYTWIGLDELCTPEEYNKLSEDEVEFNRLKKKLGK